MTALSLKFTSAAFVLLGFSQLLSAAPRLALSTATIGPVITTPGSNGPTQTVQATNLGDGSLNLTATSSASWLAATAGARGTCAANSGNCYAVSIALNTAALPPGTYTEFITLTDTNAVDSPQDIQVTVNTTGVPSSVTGYVTPNGGTASFMVFNVFTAGTGVKGTVSTQTGGNWLFFQNGSGGLAPPTAPWVIEAAALSGQAPGTYAGSIVISGSSVSSDNKTINVTMVVTTSPIILLDNTTTIRLVGGQGGDPQYSNVTLNNKGQGTLTVTSATGSAAFLTASVTGSNGLLIKADPAGLAPGTYNANLTVASNAANNSQVSIPVELVVAPAGAPAILTGGIVNISTYAQEALAVGDIGAIFGSQFAPAGTSAVASSVPLPKTLGGTQVLVNGVPAPLFFVSSGQINFQLPYDSSLAAVQLLSGNSIQVVSGASAGNRRSVPISLSVPRLLTKNAGYGAIVNSADGSLTYPTAIKDPVFKTHPARPGDVIVIYGIGFGPTSPVAIEGQGSNDGSPGKALQSISNVTVTFGGGFSGTAVSVSPAFTGLTPTTAGLYQINVTVPSNTILGSAIPLQVVVNGVQSNTVSLAISATGN